MIKVGQKVFIIYKSKVISGYVRTIGSSAEGCYCKISAGCTVPDVVDIKDVFTSRVKAKLFKYKKELDAINKIIMNREQERDSLIRKINNIENSLKD